MKYKGHTSLVPPPTLTNFNLNGWYIHALLCREGGLEREEGLGEEGEEGREGRRGGGGGGGGGEGEGGGGGVGMGLPPTVIQLYV